MFTLLTGALQSAADVVAPAPTNLQDFEYHWKQVKNFYNRDLKLQKTHIISTNLPHHLEAMLQSIIKVENETESGLHSKNECIEFLIINRPIDLLVELAVTDTLPGIRVCVLNWMRRLLSCTPVPLEHPSVLQPVQKLLTLCNGRIPSAYEEEEILFLEVVSGMVRKTPEFINLFLPAHRYLIGSLGLTSLIGKSLPKKNSLFDCPKTDTNIQDIEISSNGPHDETHDKTSAEAHECKSSSRNCCLVKCNCEGGDRFQLLDSVISFLESPDYKIVVRACEGALIIASSPAMDSCCISINASLEDFSSYLIDKLVKSFEAIPEDIDSGDIDELNVSWGLKPRDSETQNFIGRPQLHEFLSWLDYTNCVSRECRQLSEMREKFRTRFLLGTIEPLLFTIETSFVLSLLSKIVRQVTCNALMNEISSWLTGSILNDEYPRGDCLVNVLVENAQDNPDLMLSTMQFVESLIDNPHEKILHELLFRYINSRSYYDNSVNTVQSWSDEEEEREKRRGSIKSPTKSKTLAPNNILKVINNFLLLLPRQIMSKAAGTCYEEYVQDASRHYKAWICKTIDFQWPLEAISLNKDDYEMCITPGSSADVQENQASCSTRAIHETLCNDSGISEENFYEGPLLRLLFNHVKSMASQPCEINLAVIAILSKLAFLRHPYLHEILLNPEIPIIRGASTLWTSMQYLARRLLVEIPKKNGFQEQIGEAANRLLANPPVLCDKKDDFENLFDAIVVLDEFCKELAAIAFVKYHHATE